MGRHRQKRGWFNIIGSTFKTIFGTLDENDGNYFNQALNSVQDNEKHVVNLLSQQIQVVRSTISNFNNTITNLDQNRKIFNENFEKLSNYSKDLNNKIFNLEMKQTIEEHFAFLMLFTNELQNEISTIINAILFAKSNSVHPFVISPQQLINELMKTLPYLPTSATYPLPLNIQNSHFLLELTKIQYYFSEERIIFILRLPLVSQNQYYLYNLIPLPVYRQKFQSYLFILPSIKFLVLSENRNVYTTLNSLENCKNIDQSNIICDNNEPLYFTNYRPICETELLSVMSTIPENCDTRTLHTSTEMWHKLITPNSWIYVLPKATDITLSCESKKVTNLILNNTGILTLTANCKVYTSSVMLSSEPIISESSFVPIIPNFEFDDDCYKKPSNNTKENLQLTPILKNLDTDSLNFASDKLKHLEELSEELSNESFVSKISNNSYFTFIFLSLVKLFLLYIGYKIFRFIRNKCSHSHIDTSSKCAQITNCLTFNICKRKVSKHCEEIQLPNTTQCEIQNEDTPLRRSARIAKLKDTF